MEGDERKDSGGAEERVEHGNAVERKGLHRDAYERPLRDEKRRRERDEKEGEWRRKQQRRQQLRGGSMNRQSRERGIETGRKKKRIEEKEKQACTIFVGDLDPETTAEQLTGLFKRFGSVMSSKIKENHCYGFVAFDKREAAEAAIAAGQNQDGIELLNGKQVRIILAGCSFYADLVRQTFPSLVCTAMWFFRVISFALS